jgi:hypothetical protein
MKRKIYLHMKSLNEAQELLLFCYVVILSGNFTAIPRPKSLELQIESSDSRNVYDFDLARKGV